MLLSAVSSLVVAVVLQSSVHSADTRPVAALPADAGTAGEA